MPDVTFRLFVSSTFADFTAERAALRNEVLPELQRTCDELGARFELVDMRWGVNAEAADAQDAIPICTRELARCVETGLRPSLLILLGDRYGSRPLPNTIEPGAFEKIASQLRMLGDETGEHALRERYPLDENAVPAMHVLDLEPRGDARAAEAKARAAELRKLLVKGARGVSSSVRNSLDISATEREIVDGLRLGRRGGLHALAVLRTLSGQGSDGPPWTDDSRDEEAGDDEADGDDRGSATRVRALRARVASKLGNRALRMRAKLERGAVDAGYLERFCHEVKRGILQDIRRQAAQWRKVAELDAEIAAHAAFGSRRAAGFYGRAEARERIVKYFAHETFHPLLISGDPGIGKSALVAHAIAALQETHPKLRLVQRFVGATARSSRGEYLLVDLARELAPRKRGSRGLTAPTDPLERVRQTRRALTSSNQLIVVIDGLDQLGEDDIARDLRWLPAQLPKNVWLMVSAVADSFAHRQLKRKYPDAPRVELQGLSDGEGEHLLEHWLAEGGRQLRAAQSAAVLRAFRTRRSPLQLRLAASEAAQLRSTDPAIRMRTTVGGVTGTLVERLAQGRNHGRLFVERSLAYLAASRHGLSHEELRRVLWADREVRAEYERRHRRSPKEREGVAPLVWAQLFYDLSHLLAPYEMQDTEVWTFFHRQVRRAVERHLLRDGGAERHAQLAASFQPRRGSAYGARSCAELPYQLCLAGDWKALNALFFDAGYLRSALECLGPIALIEDLDFALQRGGRRLPDRLALEGVRVALAQAAHALEADRSEITPQLLGRLQGRTDAATRRLVRGLERSESSRWLAPLGAGLGAGGLLRVLGPRRDAEPTLTRSEADDREPTPFVWDLHLCADQRTLLAAVLDGTVRVWDTVSGRLLAVLSDEGSLGGVESVTATPNGRYAISGGHSGCVIVWDLQRRELAYKLATRAPAETAVAALPSGDAFVSGGSDGRVRLWNLEPGAKPRTLGKGHKDMIWRIVVAPSGQVALSVSQDGGAVRWDLRSGEHRLILQAPDAADLIRCARLTRDGRTCVAGSGGGDVVARPLARGRASVTHVHSAVVRDLVLTPKERSVISVSQSGQIAISSVGGHRLSHRLDGHGDEINAVELARDGRRLFTGSTDGMVKVWNLASLGRSKQPNHVQRIVGLREIRAGREVISADAGGNVHVWSTRSGAHVRSIPVGRVSLQQVDATRDGGLLVYVSTRRIEQMSSDYGENEEARLHVRPSLGGRGWSRRTDTYARESIFSLTPDDRHVLAVLDNDEIGVFGIDSPEPVRVLENTGWYHEAICMTPDRKRVIVRSWMHQDYERKRILVYELETRKRRVLIDRADKLFASSLRGPDQLVTAEENGRLRVWDLSSGEVVQEFFAHDGAIASMTLLPDHRRAITAGADGDLRLWDLGRGKLLRQIGNEPRIERTVLSPSGTQLFTVTSDWALQLWDAKRAARITSFTANDRIGPICPLSDDRTVVMAEDTGPLHFLRLRGKGAVE